MDFSKVNLFLFTFFKTRMKTYWVHFFKHISFMIFTSFGIIHNSNMYAKQGAKENETICVIHSKNAVMQRHRRVCVWTLAPWLKAYRETYICLSNDPILWLGGTNCQPLKRVLKRRRDIPCLKCVFFPLYTAWSSVHTYRELQQLSDQKLFIFKFMYGPPFEWKDICK